MDPRAARLAAALSGDPSDGRRLAPLCRAAGASRRTLERLFQGETHMTIGAWRQQLRLTHALRLLASGVTVTNAALESGYSAPGAFITMFKRALGTTPKRYFGASAARDAHRAAIPS